MGFVRKLGFAAAALVVLAGGKFAALFSQGNCYLRLSPEYVNASYRGESSVSVNVTTDPSCIWRPSSSQSWVRLKSVSNPASNYLDPYAQLENKGSGTLTMQVDSNSGPARVGAVSVATLSESRNFEVRQGASPFYQPPTPVEPDSCPITLAATSASIGPDGARYDYLRLGLTTKAGCKWTPVTPNRWIAPFSGSTGDGQVTMVIGANPGGDRVGTVAVTTKSDMKMFEVRQRGTGAPNGPMVSVAGAPVVFRGDGLQATQSALGQVDDVAADGSGNLYFPLFDFHQIAKLTQDGIVSIFAGNGLPGYSGDGGTRRNASLLNPRSVALDAAGNLFVGEGKRIRKIDINTGIISTAATLDGTTGKVTVQPDGTVQAVTGPTFKIGPQIVGLGAASKLEIVVPNVFTAGGTRLQDPNGLLADSKGLVFADSYTGRVYRWENGNATLLAGGGSSLSDGPSTSASLAGTWGLALSGTDLLLTEKNRHRVRRVDAGGQIRTIAGSTDPGFAGDDGPAGGARFRTPEGMATDAGGNLFIADSGNRRIRQITPDGYIRTVAGDGRATFSLDGQRGWDLQLPSFRIATDPRNSDIYISDAANHRILAMAPDGRVRVVGGNGIPGFSGDDGPALEASLYRPSDIAVSSAGTVYFVDAGNSRIRAISNGVISTVATGFTAKDLAVDPDGNLYVIDQSYHFETSNPPYWVQVIRPDGKMFPVAYFLSVPASIAVDSEGYLYIAETEAQRVTRRRPVVTASGASTPSPDQTTSTSDFDNGGPTVLAALPRGRGFAAKLSYNIVYVRDGVISGTVGASYGPVSYQLAIDRPDLGNYQIFSGTTDIAIDGFGRLYLADNTSHHLFQIMNTTGGDSGFAEIVAPSPIQLQGFAGGPPVRGTFLIRARHPDNLLDLGVPFLISPNNSWLAVAPDQSRAFPLSPYIGVTPRTVDVVADPGKLTENTYQGSLTAVIDSVQFAGRSSSTVNIPVNFVVTGNRKADFSVDKRRLDFAFARSASSRTETLLISNTGSGSIRYTVAVNGTSASGLQWLFASPAEGSAPAATPASVRVTADPAGLPAGTYNGRITITSPDVSRRTELPVTMTVSGSDQVLRLTQTGLSFVSVGSLPDAPAPVVPAQSFGVLNLGRGVMDWTAEADTGDSGNWLKVSPATGTTDASGAAPSVQVRIDQKDLPPGDYSGTVVVRSRLAANRAQVVTVFLKVLPPDGKTPALIDTTNLLFTANTGENPSSQDILVYNVSSEPKTFQTAFSSSWLRLSIPEGTLDPFRPLRIAVAVVGRDEPTPTNTAPYAWTPGTYEDIVAFRFSDGSAQNVRVRFIVTGTTLLTGVKVKAEDAVTPCAPKPLLTAQALTATPSGWPIALQAKVFDECGGAMTNGSVFVQFSNGDPEVKLESLRNGLWEATWTARPDTVDGKDVKATVTAVNPDSVQRSETFPLTLNGAGEKPVFSREDVLSVASLEASSLAPGSRIVIKGSLLGGGTYYGTAPLPEQLPVDGDRSIEKTIVYITGGTDDGLLKMRLEQVEPGRVVAIVPAGVPIDTVNQVYVTRSKARSLPVYVAVAAAQPAVYHADQQGYASSQGDISVVNNGKLAAPDSPARANDLISLRCSGLGLTDPLVPVGTVAPSGANVPGVQVIIGGVPVSATVARLIPGEVNKYEVRVTVPSGVSGPDVTVRLAVAGQLSPAVTMAVAP